MENPPHTTAGKGDHPSKRDAKEIGQHKPSVWHKVVYYLSERGNKEMSNPCSRHTP